MTSNTQRIDILKNLETWSARYLSAAKRNPESASLKPMLDVIGNYTAMAFQNNASLDEVAEAVGLR